MWRFLTDRNMYFTVIPLTGLKGHNDVAGDGHVPKDTFRSDLNGVTLHAN